MSMMFRDPDEATYEEVNRDHPLPVRLLGSDGQPLTIGRKASGENAVLLASLATSQQLLPSNPSRLGLMLTNTDANTARIKYGATATASVFTAPIASGAYWEMPQPIWTGAISVIWDADGTGSLIGSELI